MQEEEAEDLDAARLSNEDAVALLTVHRAKGLEWDVVFVPALYRGNFPSYARLHEDPFRFPQILPYELRLDRDSLPPITDTMSEQMRKEVLGKGQTTQEWRTAYVAVTRARSRLYASGAWWVGSPAPQKNPSRQSDLFELIAGHADKVVVAEKPGPRPKRIRRESNGGAPDPVFPDGWQSGLRATLADPSWPADRAAKLGVSDLFEQERQQLLDVVAQATQPAEASPTSEKVETSATGLVTYATCPRRFYWSEIDRLPRRSTKAARRGTLIHRRIELHNSGMVPFEELEADLYDRTTDEGVSGGRGDPFEAFMGSRFAEVLPRWVEIPFELQLGPSTRVRGRIDAIYTNGTTEVVDFKTGKGPSSRAARVQLEAYGLAVAETGLAEPPFQLTFAFLGQGVSEESEQADTAWLGNARSHLTKLTEAIQARNYDATPSYSCHSCDFLRFCEPGRDWVDLHPS
ncbi:MAG: PD-(D/E)XK nuclease family protein [Acidimicrobiia bacterium]